MRRWSKVVVVFYFGSFICLEYQSAWAKILAVPQEFKSISKALESAGEGDEVVVAPGVYKENVAMKKGVTLRSQSGGKQPGNPPAVIESPGFIFFYSRQIVLGADKAVLDGFTLRDLSGASESEEEQRYGILINGTTTTITNCNIASLPYNGIGINGPISNGVSVIKNSKINNNAGKGIYCDQGAKVFISGCKVYRNAAQGILNANGTQADIKHNVIYQNGADGVMNTDKADPIVTENEIYENGLNGIGLQLESKGKVLGNKIHGNQQAGVGLRLMAECVIRDNTIYENQLGVGLMDMKEAVIESNKITSNERMGIGMFMCRDGKVTIRKNDLRGNRMFAMSPSMGCEVIDEDNEK